MGKSFVRRFFLFCALVRPVRRILLANHKQRDTTSALPRIATHNSSSKPLNPRFCWRRVCEWVLANHTPQRSRGAAPYSRNVVILQYPKKGFIRDLTRPLLAARRTFLIGFSQDPLENQWELNDPFICIFLLGLVGPIVRRVSFRTWSVRGSDKQRGTSVLQHGRPFDGWRRAVTRVAGTPGSSKASPGARDSA